RRTARRRRSGGRAHADRDVGRAPPSDHRDDRSRGLRRRRPGVRAEPHLPLWTPPVRDRRGRALQIAGRAASPRSRLPAPAPARRPALAGPRQPRSRLLMRWLARWAVRLVVVVGILGVVAGVALWLAADSRPVHDIVRNRIVAALAGVVEGEVSLGRTSGRLGRRLVAEDLRIAI